MGLLLVGVNAFTEGILRVEISGPNQPQPTIVDFLMLLSCCCNTKNGKALQSAVIC
jgi:hypothetical protein